MSDYLTSILNAFHNLLFVFTKEGIISDYITPNHEDEFTQPKEVFIGKHHRDVLPPHVSTQIEQAFNNIDKGEKQYQFDYSLELKGETQWYVAVMSKMENAISSPKGLYDLIMEDFDTLSKEELLEYLKLLKHNTSITSDLLEDLLSWSKNQFQEVISKPEKINLAEITISVINSLSPNAGDKWIGLKNKVPDDIFVYADLNMVKTILRNLISNGIKFSNPGGEIVVRANNKENEVEISVTDEGIGIKKDALEKILNKESNYTTSGTKGEKGSGLGMDLCIDSVEKQGGRIWAESEPGKGTTFTFTLSEYSKERVTSE